MLAVGRTLKRPSGPRKEAGAVSGSGTLMSLSTIGRWRPTEPTYPTVMTFWPNCFSSRRLNCSTYDVLKFSATLSGRDKLGLFRAVGNGIGMPCPKAVVCPRPVWELGRVEAPVELVSICVASVDWQA